MEKEENYTASLPPSFQGLDYSHVGQSGNNNTNNNQMVDYMVNAAHTTQPAPAPLVSGFCGGGGGSTSSSFDKLSFADVMQFADFGPKLGLNETNKVSEEVETGLDPVYFLKFPVLNEKAVQEDDGAHQFPNQEMGKDGGGGGGAAVQLRFLDENVEKYPVAVGATAEGNNKGKRKRPRIKTNEEVESQRMTHIAVERNRRKQMNEHLRVLRTLMPGSYVQRGDQASIIGGAIEFVRELEQLLQCLESQKRRRLYGDAPPPPRPMAAGDSSTSSLPPIQQPPQQPPLFPEYEAAGICEETAGSKSCLADVEVKLLGFDGIIKILSRRRPGQLIKVIAALEDLQLNILHTNITTIEQTVLYSFNVKISSETTRYTAEDLANSVQQIFSFINANSI